MSSLRKFKLIYGTDQNEDLIGTMRADRMWAFAGNDRLYALDGNDELYGGDGNDLLDGGTGRDLMFGGSGNDSYRVDNAGDVVSEQTIAGQDDGGVDVVTSQISYKLTDYVERLVLGGNSAIDGVGNDLNNNIKGNNADNVLFGGGGSDIIYGYDGDDILIGGAGRDYYYGGAGADTFVFKSERGDWDRVYDFTAEDKIGIVASEYGLIEGAGLTGGVLSSDYFVSADAATAVGHGQFLFKESRYELMWDPDGAGGVNPFRIALTTANSPITGSQIIAFGDTTSASIAAFESTVQQETGGPVYFTLSLTQPANQDVILTLSTVNGTATGGQDFTALASTEVRIAAGETTVYVPIEILDDSFAEETESFSLRIDSARMADTGAALTVVSQQAQGFISDQSASIVAEHDMAALGMTDPSAIAYDPNSNSLFMSDSEVDEGPFYQPENLFKLGLDGALISKFALPFTSEPTGLAFSAACEILYMTDDDEYMVYAVAANNPTKVLYSFDTVSLGGNDPEDIAVDANTGNLFIVNGLDRTIIEIDRWGQTMIDSFVLPTEITDPEALAFDSNTGIFYVGGGFSDKIWSFDRDGQMLDVITVLEEGRATGSGHRVNVKDIELAPASDGSGDTHLYVADFGWSHVADGRLFEIDPGDIDVPHWDIA